MASPHHHAEIPNKKSINTNTNEKEPKKIANEQKKKIWYKLTQKLYRQKKEQQIFSQQSSPVPSPHHTTAAHPTRCAPAHKMAHCGTKSKK